jgi:cobalt-zinc-cadmium efflux system protein
MPHAHDHHCNHDHNHDHGHGHSHAPTDFNRAFAVGVILNSALVIGQLVFGLIAHSLALIADAGHNFADVLALLLSWWAVKLVKSPPTKTHTYGLRSASILAALTNAVVLLITMGAVGWEAILRLQHPEQVDGKAVIWLAALGIVVNAVSAALFYSGRKGDLNVRAAFVHLAADAGMSAGVVVAGVAIVWTGKSWIDPVVSLVITATILYGTWRLLRDSLNLSLHAVPANIDPDAVEKYLCSLPKVAEVHDLHIWAMSTTEVALTAHLVIEDAKVDNDFYSDVAKELEHEHGIQHATLQIEANGQKKVCQLADERHV